MYNAVIETRSIAKGLPLVFLALRYSDNSSNKGKIHREGGSWLDRTFSQGTFMWAGDNRDMICTLLILGRAKISSVPRPTQQIVRYHMQKVSVRMLNFAINSYTNFCWISQA